MWKQYLSAYTHEHDPRGQDIAFYDVTDTSFSPEAAQSEPNERSSREQSLSLRRTVNALFAACPLNRYIVGATEERLPSAQDQRVCGRP